VLVPPALFLLPSVQSSVAATPLPLPLPLPLSGIFLSP
jgi:hypothetical protein